MRENVPVPPLLPGPPDFRSYFIELRIGTLEWRLNEALVEARKRYNLGDPTRPDKPGRNLTPSLPHISLYGGFLIRPGFSLNDVKRVVSRLCRNIPFFSYRIQDYEARLGYSGGVVAFKVLPSVELSGFRSDLIRELCPMTEDLFPQNNNPGDLWYHVTIGYRLDPALYARIRAELSMVSGSLPGQVLGHVTERLSLTGRSASPLPSGLYPLNLPADALRLTILHRNMVAAEYDIMSGHWLSRRAAAARSGWNMSLSQYRRLKGYELTSPCHPAGGPVPFVIGDLHLGHSAIIRYCSRPFPYGDTRTMDSVLVGNWNHRVRSEDEVYCLGDLAVCNKTRRKQYLSLLHGTIHIIPGNHDGATHESRRMMHLTWQGIPFLFVHDPSDAPPGYEGYIVHGHHHNTDLERHPFFDPENHRFNVSAELVGYRPVPLSLLCDFIRMKTRKTDFCE